MTPEQVTDLLALFVDALDEIGFSDVQVSSHQNDEGLLTIRVDLDGGSVSE